MSAKTLTPDRVANYMVVTMRQAAGCEWPDGLTGNAYRLLIQDLAEFGAAMVACAQAGYWSPALALERLWIERVEVLMGAIANNAVAKRYLDSVAAPADPARPLKPRRKARPEDSIGALGRVTTLSDDEMRSFRAAHQLLKDVSSDWFVHPTAMGPLLSMSVRDGTEEASQSWGMMVALLTYGCAWTIVAMTRCDIPVPVELVRALDGGAQVQENLGTSLGETLRQLQQDMLLRSELHPNGPT